jgi:DNA (cytosine-5)-methyltransferase 1
MGTDKPRVVSLFAGAGGMDLGFIEAGFEVVWANELSPDACATYRLNVGPHLVEGDVGAIPSDEIPACEVVIGGPPCQGFSVAGKMDPDDPRSQLVWEFFRVVRDKRPVAFVMENVKALAHLSRWAGVRQAILSAFEGLGYDVACAVLDASRFGAPQLRERAFFVGTLRGDAADLYPAPAPEALSVRSALQQLPRHGTPGNDSLCRAKVVLAKNPVLRRSPYAGMLFNGLGRPIDLDRPAPTLPASMGGNKTPIIDQRSLETGGPGWVVQYHARLMKGGTPLRSAPPYLRRLTLEECAAIQTFPARYRFAGRQSSRFCQIGNAVPPTLARRVAEMLLRTLFPERARR